MPLQASWDSTSQVTRALVSSAWTLTIVTFPGSKGTTRSISNHHPRDHCQDNDLPPLLGHIWKTCDSFPVWSSKRGVTVISYGVLSRRSVRETRQFHLFLSDEQVSPSFQPCFICAAHQTASHWCVWFPSSGSDARRGCSRSYNHWRADPEHSSWPGWCPDEARPPPGWPEGGLSGQKLRAQRQTTVLPQGVRDSLTEPFTSNTHSLQRLERKQSRLQSGSDSVIFSGLFYVRFVSRHKSNVHTKSRSCCYDHRGDSAWQQRSMCRGTPRGCPTEVKVQKNLQSQMLFKKEVPSMRRTTSPPSTWWQLFYLYFPQNLWSSSIAVVWNHSLKRNETFKTTKSGLLIPRSAFF